MASTSAMMPMCELMAASINLDELDFDIDPASSNTLQEFEVAWKKFMKEHPELVPEGKREKNIKNLQQQVKDMKVAQTDVSDELHKQLAFFEKSREIMEKTAKKELEEARSKQMKNHERLQKQLDSIAIAEHLLSQVHPWGHFLASVDKAVEAANVNDVADTDNAKKAKPSARAMYLVDDTVGDENDVQLRAYQIDHALLDTQVKMLQKEAEGYEKLLETQATLSKFLNEYNTASSTSSKASKASRVSKVSALSASS